MHVLTIIFPVIAAIADFVAMIAVLIWTTDRGLARSFACMACSLVAWNLLLPLESTAGVFETYPVLIHVLQFGAIFVPAAVFHTAFECSGARQQHQSPALVRLGYTIACILGLLQTRNLVATTLVTHPWGSVDRPGPLFPVVMVFAVVWMSLGVFFVVRTLRRPVAPEVGLRAKYWLLAASAALPLSLTHFLANYGWSILPVWSTSGTLFVVGLIAYAAIRRRLLDLDVFVIKASAVLFTGGVLALPVVGVMTWALHPAVSLFDCFIVGLLTMAGIVAVTATRGFRSSLERGIERALFPARLAARAAVLQFSLNLVKLPRQADLGKQLTLTLFESLRLKGVVLYLRAPKSGDFSLVCAEGEIQVPPLVHARSLSEQPYALVRLTGESSRAAAELATQALDWEACVPVWADGTCLALIGLGPKRSSAAFDNYDVTLLTVVSAQLAVALKNAEYVHEIEQQKAAIEEFQKRLEAENISLRAEVQSVSEFKGIIGSSGTLQRALALVERIAPSNASILITGETGTGKELIARAIHELSPRRQGPLISVNCSAIPRELAESELFGHERGAFTDAVGERPGKFELANGGTIFLDEIGDLPLELQGKLLRVLQEHVVQRIGSHKMRQLDLRVVAATNRDLQAEMRRQWFREDLYYRLAAMVVQVPPLRERVEDIPILARYFLERAAATHQRPIKGFAPEALDALCRYSWPGNIRELQNVVERAVLLCASEVIRPEYLSDLATAPPLPFGRAIREEKRRRIERALAQTGGNQAAAARLLGISPSNLARLIKSVGAKFPPVQ
jgi:transcriptional regulator with GAF, ATPase, and Fis domain